MGTQFSRVKVDMKVLRQITAAAPEKALMVMQKIAQDVEADIKENFSAESPSNPGDAPGVDTGALKNGIRAVRANRDTWTVKCDEIYGLYLEYGTLNEDGSTRMAARPFFQPATERVAGRIPPQLMASVVKPRGR